MKYHTDRKLKLYKFVGSRIVKPNFLEGVPNFLYLVKKFLNNAVGTSSWRKQNKKQSILLSKRNKQTNEETNIVRLEEEVVQLTEKNKTQKKNISDTQTKHSADTEKLRKKLADLQSELLSKTDEVRKPEQYF